MLLNNTFVKSRFLEYKRGVVPRPPNLILPGAYAGHYSLDFLYSSLRDGDPDPAKLLNFYVCAG